MSLLKKLLHFPDLVVAEYALAVAAGVAAGAFLANGALPLPQDLVLPLAVFVFINFGLHTFNATFDRYIDLINQPRRPVPSGVYEPNEALLLSAVFYASAIILALQMPAAFTALAFCDIILTIAYSLPHIYLKKIAVLGSLAMALHYGVLSVLGGWIVYQPLSSAPFGLLIVTLLLALGCILLKDLGNLAGDEKFGVQTVPVIFGEKNGALAAAVTMVLPYLLIPVLIQLNSLAKTTLVVALLGFWALLLGKNILKDSSPENSRSVFLQAMLLGIFAMTLLAATSV